MDAPFLSISEATEKTGRSLSTIRRIIKNIADRDEHPDRSAVLPSPKDVAALKKKGENFAWKIREDVLVRECQSSLKEGKKHMSAAKTDILDILQNELNLKNEQIQKQWEVIHSLNERLREGNMLMGALQKRLALPVGEVQEENIVEASTVPASKESTTKASKKQVQKKQSILAWMFS